MSQYFSWGKYNTEDFSDDTVQSLYDQGYVFTRIDKGIMNKTRSVRVNLQNFDLTSENRRVLRKVEGLVIEESKLPIPQDKYDWSIQKMGKDFYSNKFGEKTFSANKIKSLLTDSNLSNFNTLLRYSENQNTVGYAICFENKYLLHYAYPFYDLEKFNNNYGMGMMLNALIYGKKQGLKYVYLGSGTRPADKYKLQFNGLEWFNGSEWTTDIENLKELLKSL